jgi:hypothetical protein
LDSRNPNLNPEIDSEARRCRNFRGLYGSTLANLDSNDQMHKIVTGQYLVFNPPIAIGVDSRIAKVTLSSALISPPNGMTVRQAMKGQALDKFTSARKKDIIAAWDSVLSHSSTTSILRIDSLAWQIGEMIQAKEITAKLESCGADAPIAASIGHEFTAAL